MKEYMAKFQMIDSTNPHTIAEVFAEVDIDSFRRDANWYEIIEDEPKKVGRPKKSVESIEENK